MTTSSSVFRKAVSAVASLSLVLSSFAILIVPAQAAAPNWDTSGSYVADFNYLGTDYAHDISLTQDSGGNLTGSGGSPAGANTYEWTITSGVVDGDTIEFDADYTATADAVTPQTTMHVEGTIAPDGSMSGTWSDNYQGGEREGTWSSTSGEATEIEYASVTTDAATGISENDATLNGTNGADDAVGHSFWVSTSTFSTASPTIPSEVYSTPDMGPIAADTPFSATLSSITSSGVPTNLPPIEPDTTYYYAAWSNVDGTWYPGEILTVTTDEESAGPECSTDDTTFDTFELGDVDGQHGWSSTGPYDQEVVENTYGYESFGCQSLRISNAVTSGAFGDQTFSYSIDNEAGESSAVNDGMSGGTRQDRFEAQFDLASVMPEQQSGLSLSVSPDRGDGARMSYLRFEDQADGVHVFFDDVTNAGPLGTVADFNETDIATLDRTPHTIKFVMDFVDGPANDVVEIYIDGSLVHTGTSWEDYYRYDPEQAGSGNEVPTVDSLIFRAAGTAAPANDGNGFLFDNVELSSSMAPAAPTHQVTIMKYIDGMAASTTETTASFPMNSTWAADNIGAGSGSYALSSGSGYMAQTAEMSEGASYTTQEDLTGSTVGASCSEEKPYELRGYTWGDTMQEAQMGTPSMTPPAFADMGSDKYVIVWNHDCSAPDAVVVTINKYVDGEQATSEMTEATTFNMESTWTAANLNDGIESSDTYTLGPVGYNSTNPYEAITSDMDSGSSYTTHELMDETVGESCEESAPYALAGYTWGNTMQEAQAGTPSMTAPDFENIINNKYVIVWNEACDEQEPGPEFVKVVVTKFVDGAMATSGSATSSFPMVSSTTASNINGGQPSGPNAYTLDLGNGYDATTTDMASGAYYSTSEVLTGSTVGATCQEGKQYALAGYSSGNTLTAAAAASSSMTAPMFNNLTTDKYVIVWNTTCTATSTGTTTDAALHVDSIDAQKTDGVANDTYEDGWKYVFRITAPTNEENLSMRFSDWIAGANTIPVANNMRISSAQASSTSPVTLTAANAYSTPPLVMVSDLDLVAPGRQVDVLVELKIPVGTANDSYTTTYGVQTLP